MKNNRSEKGVDYENRVRRSKKEREYMKKLKKELLNMKVFVDKNIIN